MSVYCFWMRTKELDNGDMEVTRLETDPETLKSVEEAVVVVPKAEREHVAKALLGHYKGEVAPVRLTVSMPEGIDIELDEWGRLTHLGTFQYANGTMVFQLVELWHDPAATEAAQESEVQV
jgi:hypothetical protein